MLLLRLLRFAPVGMATDAGSVREGAQDGVREMGVLTGGPLWNGNGEDWTGDVGKGPPCGYACKACCSWAYNGNLVRKIRTTGH